MKSVYGQHTPLFSVMEWMDEHIPENAKIGFSGFQLHYPLFGRTLKRDVDYIAVNKCHGCNYHDYRSSGGNIFVNPEYSEWISNIQYYNKEYYVFFSKENTFPDTELHWLKEHPEVFKLLYNEKNAYIFKIKNSR